MTTQTDLPPIDETANLVPAPTTRGPFALFATIKKSSKYYYQGLNADNKPGAFEITRIDDSGYYRFHGNHNRYRADDLTFWIETSKGKFTKLR